MHKGTFFRIFGSENTPANEKMFKVDNKGTNFVLVMLFKCLYN